MPPSKFLELEVGAWVDFVDSSALLIGSGLGSIMSTRRGSEFGVGYASVSLDFPARSERTAPVVWWIHELQGR